MTCNFSICSPDEVPVFVGAIGGKKGSVDYNNYKFTIMGENLFAALYLHIGQLVNKADPFKMTTLQKLKESIHVHASMKNQDQSFSLEAKTTAMKGMYIYFKISRKPSPFGRS